MTIAIVTDSTASLSAADAQQLGIHVVPVSVVIGAKVYTEGVDVTADMIAEALGSFVPVSTSRPSVETFEAVFRSLILSGATEIVSVHISSKISGTLESAQLAAQRVAVPVHVVDTLQVGLGTGYAAGRAARAARAGKSVEDVIAAAENVGQVSDVLVYVDSLEYLRRGGRIGTAAALIGSALAVKPILTLENGMVAPLEKVRTASRALARLVAMTVEKRNQIAGDYDLGVQHLGASEQAATVAERLADALDRDSVPVDEIGAALGAHLGPGMIGVTIAAR